MLSHIRTLERVTCAICEPETMSVKQELSHIRTLERVNCATGGEPGTSSVRQQFQTRRVCERLNERWGRIPSKRKSDDVAFFNHAHGDGNPPKESQCMLRFSMERYKFKRAAKRASDQ